MNHKTKTFAPLAACALVAAGMIAGAAPSSAFRMLQNTATDRVTAGFLVTCNDPNGFARWNNHNINWFHNTANQGANVAGALQAALQSWTDVPNATHRLNYAGTTTDGWATDGRNTVLWANGNGCGTNCLALTALVLQQGQIIVESDVTFNDSFTWNTNGTDFDVQAVAAHEFGHTLGIHHTELTGAPQSTMSTPYFGTDGRTLEADDRAALQCSQSRYCGLSGSGFVFAGRRFGDVSWVPHCLVGGSVDVFRNGVRVASNTPNDGFHRDTWITSTATSANFWVCEAGSTTSYDSNRCTNVITVGYSQP